MIADWNSTKSMNSYGVYHERFQVNSRTVLQYVFYLDFRGEVVRGSLLATQTHSVVVRHCAHGSTGPLVTAHCGHCRLVLGCCVL